MEVNEVSRERWPFQLAPQLTWKAQQAYAALQPEDGEDYNMVKTAILCHYNINEETYHQRFRAVKPKEDESPQELMMRLQDLGRGEEKYFCWSHTLGARLVLGGNSYLILFMHHELCSFTNAYFRSSMNGNVSKTSDLL